jgi:hypothetical protein
MMQHRGVASLCTRCYETSYWIEYGQVGNVTRPSIGWFWKNYLVHGLLGRVAIYINEMLGNLLLVRVRTGWAMLRDLLLVEIGELYTLCNVHGLGQGNQLTYEMLQDLLLVRVRVTRHPIGRNWNSYLVHGLQARAANLSSRRSTQNSCRGRRSEY